MKKSLLFAVALAATTSVFAQKAQTMAAKVEMPSIASFNRGAFNGIAKPAVALNMNAPLRTFATGMYYNRPVGTYYYPTSGVTYLIVPPFTPLTYRNQSTNPSSTEWHINGETLTAEDGVQANGDLTVTYNKILDGYLNYLPALISGADSFAIGDGNGSTYTNGVIQANSTDYLSYLDLGTIGGYYQCFSVSATDPQGEEYAFGTKSSTVYRVTEQGDTVYNTYHENGIMQIFDKPAAPLYLSNIVIPGCTSSPDSLAISGDGVLTLTIVPLDTTATTFAGMLASEPLATWTCSANDVSYGSIRTLVGTEEAGNLRKIRSAQFTFSEKQTVLGQQTTVPVLIDQPFAIEVKGFAGDSVNCGFGLADNGSNLPEYTITYQTYNSYSDMDGYASARGRYSGGYYSYQCPIWLVGYMDVVRVDTTDSYNVLTAPADGGAAVNGVGVGALAYTNEDLADTTTGEWNETYDIVQADGSEAPDWITYSVDKNNVYNGQAIITVNATASTEKRSAILYLENTLTGVRSADPIYVLQNTNLADGISAATIENVKAEKDNRIFNLAGQQVTKAYKGVVIKNGKKFVQK